MRIDIHPSTVSSIGDKAHGIGADVARTRRHVDDAWQDAASGITGFGTHAALDAYTDHITAAVRKLGREVHEDGTKLKSSANTVHNHDGASSEHMHTAARRCVSRVNTCPYEG